MTDTYDPLKAPAADGFTFVGTAVDPAIEKALAPSKEEWKYPLWTRLKNYAIGFGAALILVACIIGAIAYFMPPLAPQTELPKTADVAPDAKCKSCDNTVCCPKDQIVEPNKKANPVVKKVEAKPTVNKMETVEKPKPIDLSPIDIAPIPPSPPFPPN